MSCYPIRDAPADYILDICVQRHTFSWYWECLEEQDWASVTWSVYESIKMQIKPNLRAASNISANLNENLSSSYDQAVCQLPEILLKFGKQEIGQNERAKAAIISEVNNYIRLGRKNVSVSISENLFCRFSKSCIGSGLFALLQTPNPPWFCHHIWAPVDLVLKQQVQSKLSKQLKRQIVAFQDIAQRHSQDCGFLLAVRDPFIWCRKKISLRWNPGFAMFCKEVALRKL